MGVDITTRSFTVNRDGANLAETILTPAAVRSRGIRQQFALPTPDDRRGCEAQTLLCTGCTIGQRTVDVAIQMSMGNTVYAYDARTGELLWQHYLGPAVKGNRTIDAYLINDHWGVLSTGCVDKVNNLVWGVCWLATGGSKLVGTFKVFALNISTGALAAWISLDEVIYNPPHGEPQRFNRSDRKQRASLLLDKGYLYLGFGTIAETANTAQGWIIAVDTSTRKVNAAFATTVAGVGAGVWMAGQGLSLDRHGRIHLMTGNGDFNPATGDYGESFLRLYHDPMLGTIEVDGWWTPFTDEQREGLGEGERAPRKSERDSVGRANNLMPSMPGMEMGDSQSGMPDMVMPAAPTNVRHVMALATGQYADMDLGSGGSCTVDELDVVLGAGKDGVLYCVDNSLAQMGGTTPHDLDAPAKNYARLWAPPIFATYYAPDKNPAPDDARELNMLYGGKTHHQHSTPVYYRSERNGRLVFIWGENGVLKCYRLNPTRRAVEFVAEGDILASADKVNPPGGMPGGMLSLTANGARDGILWACIPYGDANMEITRGRLLAYDAENIVGGRLTVLWDSAQWGWQFSHNKFNIAVAANGQLFLPTYDGKTLVLGLA